MSDTDFAAGVALFLAAGLGAGFIGALMGEFTLYALRLLGWIKPKQITIVHKWEDYK